MTPLSSARQCVARIIENNAYIQNFLFRYLADRHKQLIENYDNVAIFAFDRIGLAITLIGKYEQDELNCLTDVVLPQIAAGSSIALDIGANIGNHTLTLASRCGEVCSFEPHPEVYELLKFNTRKAHNVKVLNMAASSRTGSSIIVSNQATSTGSSSILEDDIVPEAAEVFYIKLEKIDNVVSEYYQKQPIALIKLDAEGHELEALNGARETIENNSPVIVFEQHGRDFVEVDGRLSSSAIDYVTDLGYKFYYELSCQIAWRASGTLPRPIRKILNFIELAVNGLPKKQYGLVQMDRFAKKKYPMIIASTKPLKT